MQEALEVQVPREDEDDVRWARTGWVSQDVFCDEVARYAFEQIKGIVLEQRWLVQDYPVSWSVTASYHLLWVAGKPVIRIWTNTKANATVELSDLLCDYLKDYLVICDIPEGTIKNRPEFSKRTYVAIIEEMDMIIKLTKRLYGLESK